jgi:GNAT superfamily N-acetyltransferase
MNIIYREANKDDIPSCVNAFSFILEDIQDFSENDLTLCDYNIKLFRDLLTESISCGVCPIIAEHEGRKVGWNLIIKLSGFIFKYETANAFGTYVLKEYRGNGIATKMSEIGFKKLKENGISKVFGKTFAENPGCQTHYETLGLSKELILCKIL